MHLQVFDQPSAATKEVVAAVRESGPTMVLLLHGWGRTHADWDRVIDLLPPEFSILAPDLPGFGATPPPSHALGAAGYAEVLPSLLAGVRPFEQLVVVGHSFGGRVALAGAATVAPRGLVLAAVPIIPPPPPPTPLGYRVVRLLRPLVGHRGLERARRRFGSEDYRRAEGVMREVLVRVVHESYRDELARLLIPVVMVWGAKDTTCPLALAHEAAALNPLARLEVLEEVGHMVPLRAPEAVARAVMAIVDESKLGR